MSTQRNIGRDALPAKQDYAKERCIQTEQREFIQIYRPVLIGSAPALFKLRLLAYTGRLCSVKMARWDFGCAAVYVR